MNELKSGQRFAVGLLSMCFSALMFVWALLTAIHESSVLFGLFAGVFGVMAVLMYVTMLRGVS